MITSDPSLLLKCAGKHVDVLRENKRMGREGGLEGRCEERTEGEWSKAKWVLLKVIEKQIESVCGWTEIVSVDLQNRYFTFYLQMI